MDGCKDCGMAYSMVFGVQFHKATCETGKQELEASKVLAKAIYGANPPWRRPHDCEENAVPYTSTGALGHGWECGICGKFLQAG